MTLRNRTPQRQPSRAPKTARPRLPRGPKPSERGTNLSSPELRQHKDQPVSRPPAPPATQQTEAAPTRTPAKNPPNGSASGSSGGPSLPILDNRVASPVPYNRDKTRTLTVKEAAYRLNRSADSVHQWLRQGRLRGWQLGGPRCGVMVCAESVEQALLGQVGANGETDSA